MTSPCQKDKNNNKPKIKYIKRKISQKLTNKYEVLFQKYNSNIIDNIIYNERSHIVAVFKDRLILDDNGEFLKRYYKYDESYLRLPKFFEYYDLYSKIFPNYTSLPEGKYFYQNIQKKQKMIDIQEQIELENQKRNNIYQNEKSKINISDDNILNNNKSQKKKNKDYVFSTEAIHSILNGTNMEFVEILFNINKNNLENEENAFCEKINNIINIITVSENNNHIINNKNKNKKHKSTSKKKENKSKSNSSKKNKINKTVLGKDINNNKIVKLNHFNKSNFRKNTIFNLNKNKKSNNSIYLQNNNNINKIKNDKNFIKIIEHNIFYKKQLSSKYYKKNKNKNLFHNISSSTSMKKELSKSKRNSSNNSKKPSGSTSSYNILSKNNSLHYRIKNYNKISSKINNKKLEIKMKNSLKSPLPLISRSVAGASNLNFSLNNKKINKCKKIQTKYTYSCNNIHNNKNQKKSLNNVELHKNKKNNNILNNYKKININNSNLQKKINNITNNIKKINKRKIIQYNHKNNNSNLYNNILNKKSKCKNNTYYIIDYSRNYILNEFLNSYKHHKSNSTKKNSVNSRSSSRYNKSKSKSKSNKKNKNNLFDSNNSYLFNQKNKTKNIANKNIINKFNWKIDSRNKRPLFISKNLSKYKTKNIYQNDTSLKSNFLGVINNIKNKNKIQDSKNYSKIFKYINNKNCCSTTQRNYSFNNI